MIIIHCLMYEIILILEHWCTMLWNAFIRHSLACTRITTISTSTWKVSSYGLHERPCNGLHERPCNGLQEDPAMACRKTLQWPAGRPCNGLHERPCNGLQEDPAMACRKTLQWPAGRLSTITGSWTGLPDWTTGLDYWTD